MVCGKASRGVVSDREIGAAYARYGQHLELKHRSQGQRRHQGYHIEADQAGSHEDDVAQGVERVLFSFQRPQVHGPFFASGDQREKHRLPQQRQGQPQIDRMPRCQDVGVGFVTGVDVLCTHVILCSRAGMVQPALCSRGSMEKHG